MKGLPNSQVGGQFHRKINKFWQLFCTVKKYLAPQRKQNVAAV